MNILISSHYFFPEIGGITAVSANLANEFVRRGHTVKLVTQTVGETPRAFPFDVIRKPGKRELLGLVKWCDVFFHNNLSLTTAWPLLLVRRPWIVTHQCWIDWKDPHRVWENKIKRAVLRYAKCVSISNPIAEGFPSPSTIIGNPYDETVFRLLPGDTRDRELIFVGRLWRDKGVPLLLDALAALKQIGLPLRLTVVGGGPDRQALEEQSVQLGIEGQVEFVGPKDPEEIVGLLNTHQCMVVPSLWNEPFGIVALEGAACGCVVVGSEGGGLGEAIGPSGPTFPNGDLKGLTAVLADLFHHPERFAEYRDAGRHHVTNYTLAEIGRRYEEIFSDLTRNRARAGLVTAEPDGSRTN